MCSAFGLSARGAGAEPKGLRLSVKVKLQSINQFGGGAATARKDAYIFHKAKSYSHTHACTRTHTHTQAHTHLYVSTHEQKERQTDRGSRMPFDIALIKL